MKSFDDAFRIEKDHAIVDCCPREGDLPIDHPDVRDIYILSTGLFTEERKRYTLYLNIHMLLHLAIDDPVEVRCDICDSVYRLPHHFLDEKWKVARPQFFQYLDGL